MSVGTGIAIYFLIWWLTLFAVLPWGVRSQAETGAVQPGTDPGAPSIPRLAMKLLWTTAISALVFAAGYLAYRQGLIGLDSLDWILGVSI